MNTLLHTEGFISTELNARKGIWCEFCTAECSSKHLITVNSEQPNNFTRELLCIDCATSLVNCLRKSLTDALLTDKEIT